MNIKEMSLEELKNEHRTTWGKINVTESYSTNDLFWFDSLEEELFSRGYEVIELKVYPRILTMDD